MLFAVLTHRRLFKKGQQGIPQVVNAAPAAVYTSGLGVAGKNALRCMSPAYTPLGAFNIHSDIARDPGTPNENGHFQMFLGSTSCKEEATVGEDNIAVPEEALEQVQGLGLRVHQSGT